MFGEVLCYNESSGGADIAFDNWTLTGYFASRFYTLRILLIAESFASKIKNVAASFASLFQVRNFAPAVSLV